MNSSALPSSSFQRLSISLEDARAPRPGRDVLVRRKCTNVGESVDLIVLFVRGKCIGVGQSDQCIGPLK